MRQPRTFNRGDVVEAFTFTDALPHHALGIVTRRLVWRGDLIGARIEVSKHGEYWDAFDKIEGLKTITESGDIYEVLVGTEKKFFNEIDLVPADGVVDRDSIRVRYPLEKPLDD